MVTILCAYLLICLFFVGIERGLRQGEQAKSWKPGQYDRGSQVVVGTGLAITMIVLLVAPALNHFHFYQVRHNWFIGGLGLLIMIAGIGLRYWAAKTLGEFYTRTLFVTEQHPVVDQGPYRVIRHPGYLGVILMFIGAGFATVNWVVIVMIPIVLLIVYSYRIYVEEKMLLATLGEPYILYRKKSWRIIPFVY